MTFLHIARTACDKQAQEPTELVTERWSCVQILTPPRDWLMRFLLW